MTRRALWALPLLLSLACAGSGTPAASTTSAAACPGGVTTSGRCCERGCACGASCISCAYDCHR